MNADSMNVVGHLVELRRRLLFTAFSFLVAVVSAFLNIKPVYHFLASRWDQKLVILGPTDIIWIYFVLSGVIALAVTLPIAAYQAWKFVSPALRERERTVAFYYVPAVFILFVGGIVFGYVVVFPTVFGFLSGMATDEVTALYTVEKYFHFLMNVTLPFGFLFEMPAVVLFLSQLGILNPARMRKFRKPAYMVLVVAAVMISPPDFVSHMLVVVPMLLLYELSVTFSGIVYRRKKLTEI